MNLGKTDIMIKVISVGDIMPGGILHGTKSEFLSEVKICG